MKFVPATPEEKRQMLEFINVSSFDELVAHVPEKLKSAKALDLPPSLPELGISKLARELAGANIPGSEVISFLGAGSYDHLIPAAYAVIPITAISPSIRTHSCSSVYFRVGGNSIMSLLPDKITGLIFQR